MADKTVTVGPGKTYASLQAAIAGEKTANPNLVTMGGILNIVLYAFNDTTTVNITGFTLSATRYINIYTDPSARHAGVWDGSKYNLIAASKTTAITIATKYTVITGLQIGVRATSDYGTFDAIKTTGGYTTACGNILRCVVDPSYSSSTWGFDDSYTAGNNKVFNNIIYGFNRLVPTDGAGGIYAQTSGDYIYNNTIVNCSHGIYLELNKSGVVKNNLISNCVLPIFGADSSTWVGSGYNATDSSSWGAGSTYTSLTGDHLSNTFSFVNSGSQNYLLSSSDTGALGLGTDLSADLYCPFTIDILGVLRTDPWSIGAHQPATIVTTSLPWQTHTNQYPVRNTSPSFAEEITLPLVPDINGPIAVDPTLQTLFNQAFEGTADALSIDVVSSAKDTGDNTALHWLAIRQVVGVLQNTCVSTKCNYEDETPLHLLAEQGRVEALQDPCVATVHGCGGWTPLRRLADSVDAAHVATLVAYLNTMPSDPEDNMAVLRHRGLI
jgi:parallel beta-helix repeat protein